MGWWSGYFEAAVDETVEHPVILIPSTTGMQRNAVPLRFDNAIVSTVTPRLNFVRRASAKSGIGSKAITCRA